MERQTSPIYGIAPAVNQFSQTFDKARGKAESSVDREAGQVFVIVFPAETFVSG